jgi:hypothetical protein
MRRGLPKASVSHSIVYIDCCLYTFPRKTPAPDANLDINRDSLDFEATNIADQTRPPFG